MTYPLAILFFFAACCFQLWLDSRGISLFTLVRRWRTVYRIRKNLGVTWRAAYYIATGQH
ncbi:MAG: hypothetical protein LBI31_01610 [Zoogloeaceae bacterium]|jgi:hypothetical protein|nr:hypothetical protein [Zoogloeaceae bacterium]